MRWRQQELKLSLGPLLSPLHPWQLLLVLPLLHWQLPASAAAAAAAKAAALLPRKLSLSLLPLLLLKCPCAATN
jgi:hypothetical protein